ncbi:MAG TPA: DNA repair protein RecO [Stellaceae bacterium]|nr:DNA repair protein RecO [Stellaceae bacterium]
MQWSETGIVLAVRRHGESALVVHLLTRERGRHAGLVHGGQGRRGRTIYQLGNAVAVTWRARLEEQLGTFSGELTTGHAARVIDDPARLACLSAAAAMAEAALPEREPHPRAYDGLAALLDALDRDLGWAALYARWELALLAELGFGLDLARCAATGASEDLVYVSPKSGQAVSRAAGEPNRKQLLPLPGFLLNGGAAEPSGSEIGDALSLTGFFWERRVFQPHGRKLPAARSRFVDRLGREATHSAKAVADTIGST